MTDLNALADRVERLLLSDNSVDVLCEIALFEPDEELVAIRANAAGTKVIYTTVDGIHATSWAFDWTMDFGERANTATLLRARALSTKDQSQ